MSLKEALDVAMERGLDLVEIAPMAKPPVCRLMDYGKFKFEQSKREKEARKKQKVIEVKEIKMRPGIEEHDLMVKAKNARRFLNSGDKVKVTIVFKGRQITHPELGEKLCLRFAEELSDLSNMEKPPKMEGKNMVMVLAPKPENEKKEEKNNA